VPITIYQPIGPNFGPGLIIVARSDTLSIDAGATDWTVRVIGGPQEREIYQQIFRSSSDQMSGQIGLQSVHPIITPDYAPDAGTSISIEIGVQTLDGLEQDSSVISGYVWAPTAASWALLPSTLQTPTGGFTDADRQQLQLIDATTTATRSAVTTSVQTSRGAVTMDLGAAFRWVSQDLWVDHPLTIGPTCDPIDIEVSLNALFGVTLEIDSYPESVVLRTPDNSWSFPDLAVLSFERNGDLLARHGVHTLSHSVSPLPGCVWIGAFGFNVPIQPTGYHIKVDWLPGVCGHITGQILPVRE
jgi:hypothetical protein